MIELWRPLPRDKLGCVLVAVARIHDCSGLRIKRIEFIASLHVRIDPLPTGNRRPSFSPTLNRRKFEPSSLSPQPAAPARRSRRRRRLRTRLRARVGPFLLAHIVFCKYGLHLPLNCQARPTHGEGVELDVSTLAYWVGAASATLMPLVEAIRAQVFAAQRTHVDDTTVPVLAKGKCRTGRLWTYGRDDRPFAGTAAPAAAFFYSADRGAVHPDAHLAGYAGLMQADAYAGFNRLYEASHKPGPIVEALCWAHGRRKFFDLPRLNKAPIPIEAVERIDALFAIERDINGKPPSERGQVRNERSRPLVTEQEAWLRKQRAKLSTKNEVAKAITCSLNQWCDLVRFLDDGRLCMSNNAAERALRCVEVGRNNWTFAGSDEGGRRPAAVYTLIETAKLNDIDPRAWLADVLARLPDHPARRIRELLPWNRKAQIVTPAAA
jgi:transposase